MAPDRARVLVVDDEPASLELFKDFLLEENYEVETAKNGMEALSFLSANKVDIVLSDIQMPKMDGLTLLKETKKLYPATEVILMTAYGGLPSAVEALRYGVYDYLTKPISGSALINTVNRCLEKITLKRDLEKSQRKLVEQEKLAAIGSVAAWLSHRMRNALSVISMCSHFLGQKAPADLSDDLKVVLSTILSKSKALERIASDLITYSKSYELEMHTENVNGILRELLITLTPQIEMHQIVLTEKLDAEAPDIECDPHLLQEAFENVLLNALQAIGAQKGESLQVETVYAAADNTAESVPANLKGTVKVRVTNTGSYVSKEDASKVFVPFFTTKENGSGLGLAIVKKIIDQHGGTVGVISSDQNGAKKTSLEFSLPVTHSKLS